MMTFKIATFHPDVNAKDGVRLRHWLVRARNELDAGVDLPGTGFRILEAGPVLDERAIELGIIEGGAVEIDDGEQ
jgi:hypothetical protein